MELLGYALFIGPIALIAIVLLWPEKTQKAPAEEAPSSEAENEPVIAETAQPQRDEANWRRAYSRLS